ncbi:MAG: hypothetical protein AUG51_25700 [Acidobacteria bacterium 13_1_20CM_3_53_8]|nr:MAG: hypothetical protein AUG51_25700 [Acidobacteria bacterium 13_1_20CM_3_53_8]
MSTTFHATYDGKVLHPEEEVDLKPNTRYIVIIEGEEKVSEIGGEEEYPLTAIRSLATDMGVSDLAENHDYYAHGRSKNTDLP